MDDFALPRRSCSRLRVAVRSIMERNRMPAIRSDLFLVHGHLTCCPWYR